MILTAVKVQNFGNLIWSGEIALHKKNGIQNLIRGVTQAVLVIFGK
jgi:hypothetical protein